MFERLRAARAANANDGMAASDPGNSIGFAIV